MGQQEIEMSKPLGKGNNVGGGGSKGGGKQ